MTNRKYRSGITRPIMYFVPQWMFAHHSDIGAICQVLRADTFLGRQSAHPLS